MKEIKIIFNTSFIGLNEYINAERKSKFLAAEIKKNQTSKVAYLAHNAERIDCKCDVRIEWYKPDNRKDHDNISFAKKFIFDGLKSAKVIMDDSPKWIGNFKDEFILDKTRNYISCIVYLTPHEKTHENIL